MSALALFAAGLIVVPSGTQELATEVTRAAPSGGKSSAVLVEVSVNPEGKAYRCEPLHVTGDEAFGPLACRSHRRWRLAEPKDADGLPTFGVFRSIAVYSFGPSLPRELQGLKHAPDITLSLDVDNGISVSDFVINAAISQEGRVTHCEGKGETPEALVAAACEATLQRDWDVLLNAENQPVSHVRMVVIHAEKTPAS